MEIFPRNLFEKDFNLKKFYKFNNKMKKVLNPDLKDLVNAITTRKLVLPSLYPDYLQKLNKDELYLLALELDLPDLIRFCKTSKKINEKVCRSNEIWIHKLKEDFKITYSRRRYNLEPKKLYILLYKLKDGILEGILDYVYRNGAQTLYDLLYNPSSTGLLLYSLPYDNKDRRKMEYIISFLNEQIYEIIEDNDNYEDDDETIEELWFKYREKLSSLLPFNEKGVQVTLEDIDNFWDNAGDLITKIQEKSENKLIKGIKKREEMLRMNISNEELETTLSINELVKNNVFSITMQLDDLLNYFE
jgi:hypothetical protein